MHDATRTLADFSDKELADMIRNGCYSRNTRFGFGPDDARFLLVLAVPYGRDEDVETLTEALDGFLRFCSDDDANERQFQVYDHAASQRHYECSLEEAEINSDDEEVEA